MTTNIQHRTPKVRSTDKVPHDFLQVSISFTTAKEMTPLQELPDLLRDSNW